eukprot:gene14224-20195_t
METAHATGYGLVTGPPCRGWYPWPPLAGIIRQFESSNTCRSGRLKRLEEAGPVYSYDFAEPVATWHYAAARSNRPEGIQGGDLARGDPLPASNSEFNRMTWTPDLTPRRQFYKSCTQSTSTDEFTEFLALPSGISAMLPSFLRGGSAVQEDKDITAYPSFPWCNCILCGPVRLAYNGTITVKGTTGKNTTYLTFAIVLVDIPPPKGSKCFDMDIFKLEVQALASGHGCTRNAMVDGKYRTPQYDVVNTQLNVGLIRLSQLQFTQDDVRASMPAGIPVWLQLEQGASCTFEGVIGNEVVTTVFNTEKTCCPGQFPPSPSSGFPFCTCNRNPFASQWRAEVKFQAPLRNGGQFIVLRIYELDGVKFNYGGMEKLEIELPSQEASTKYNRAFQDVIVGRSSTSAIYWERSRPVVKFTNLGLKAGMGEVDLAFNVMGATLAEICGGNCTYAAFESPTLQGACPIGTLFL